jgi:hypothetical protein
MRNHRDTKNTKRFLSPSVEKVCDRGRLSLKMQNHPCQITLGKRVEELVRMAFSMNESDRPSPLSVDEVDTKKLNISESHQLGISVRSRLSITTCFKVSQIEEARKIIIVEKTELSRRR